MAWLVAGESTTRPPHPWIGLRYDTHTGSGPPMLITGFPAGPWATNCFVLAAGPGSECLIIDPGKDAHDPLRDIMAEHRLKPVAVLLSHGHLDHTWSVFPVCDGYGIPAYIHPGDEQLLADPMAGISTDMRMMLSSLTGGRLHRIEPDRVEQVVDGAVLPLAGLDLTVRHGPGHTPGSVSYHLSAPDIPPVMFSGDLLFAGSIGRTDLPGGDHGQMMASLARVVLPLDDQTVVLPGHGEQTTIGRERRVNPYLRMVAEDLAPQPPRRGR